VTDKIYLFIGLAMKAGKRVSGEVNCEKTIKSGKACLVIVSEDASANTEKKFKDACIFRKLPLYSFGKKEELGRLLGDGIRSVIAVTDAGFAHRLADMLRFHNNGKKNNGGGLIE